MKTFLLIGMGNFGHHLARSFAQQHCEMMIVDEREQALEDLLSLGVSAKIGDCTNPETLRSFDVPSFDACFVSVGSDFQTSLEITSLLKELGAAYVYSRAATDVHAKFLLRNGADQVIYPEKETAESLAVSASNDSIFDCIPLIDGVSVYEISAPQAWLGKTIRELAVRPKYGINILGTIRDGKATLKTAVDYVFNADDHLMVLASAESMRNLPR